VLTGVKQRDVREVLAAGPFVSPCERLAAVLGHELTIEPLVAGVARALEVARAASQLPTTR